MNAPQPVCCKTILGLPQGNGNLKKAFKSKSFIFLNLSFLTVGQFSDSSSGYVL